MNRGDFQVLARIRLVEARALIQNGHYDGGYYLAGYAVECALKACIAKLTQRYDFPRERSDVYTHNLDALVRAAGLEQQLRQERDRDPVFHIHWATVKDWKETSRYERKTDQEAADLYNAITDMRHGVMRWLRRHW